MVKTVQMLFINKIHQLQKCNLLNVIYKSLTTIKYEMYVYVLNCSACFCVFMQHPAKSNQKQWTLAYCIPHACLLKVIQTEPTL